MAKLRLKGSSEAKCHMIHAHTHDVYSMCVTTSQQWRLCILLRDGVDGGDRGQKRKCMPKCAQLELAWNSAGGDKVNINGHCERDWLCIGENVRLCDGNGLV